MNNLTKNAKKFLRIMYVEYKHRIKSGVSAADAVLFGELDEFVKQTAFDGDAVSACCELIAEKLIVGRRYEGSYITLKLKPPGIAYMDALPLKAVKSVFTAIAKIKSLLLP